jgi:hypothetical protein
MTMRPRKSTRFDMSIRVTMWFIICFFTGFMLVDGVMAGGGRRKKPPGAVAAKQAPPACEQCNPIPLPDGVIVPPPPPGCPANSANMTVTPVDQPNYQAFTLGSAVLCGAGLAGDVCPYFVEYTIWYQWLGVWFPGSTDTLQFQDTCGKRNTRMGDIVTGHGTYQIVVKTYRGYATDPNQVLLFTTAATHTFQ